jgi:hypothetical protein
VLQLVELAGRRIACVPELKLSLPNTHGHG